MSTAIKITDLSKIYRLGEIGTGTLQHDLQRWYKMRIRGQEDPFLKIGEANDSGMVGISDVVYSLRDINLEIEQGVALGIIGKNGAGKSTLLKLISRVTSPTTGRIEIKGRVASLLEVGTGFHPELTGRENIFLNGAILGMRKKEIQLKLDEIIEFSGVARYIDTPVKRYSSGMYVRLAFAVAAHLDSEILIVDEVLAVGDAEFQKKCLGKMGEISKGEGRTVLFVSHNMSAVKSLCSNALLLQRGVIHKSGVVSDVIDYYLNPPKENRSINIPENTERYGTGEAIYKSFYITDTENHVIDKLYYLQPFILHFEFEVKRIVDGFHQFVFWNQFADSQGTIISMASSIDDGSKPLKFDVGLHKIRAEININLTPGSYIINIAISNMQRNIDNLTNICSFEVSEIAEDGKKSYPWGAYRPGFIVPDTRWIY
jgi:lipopolysaccharide transport system ATP-binding protein